MQKCQTWAGLAVGIWLPAGEASSHTNSSGTSCCVCLQGREKKREQGESRYCLWCFSFAAGEGLSCVRLGLLVIFCRGDHIRKSSHPSLCQWWASLSWSSAWLAQLNASQTASHGDASVPHLCLWVLSMGRLWWSLWVRITEVHAHGALQGPFLIDRVVGAFPLSLQWVLREGWGTWQGNCSCLQPWILVTE